MSLKQFNEARLASIVLVVLALAAAQAAIPRSHTSDRVCRGTLAHTLDYSILPLKTVHGPATQSCPLSAFSIRKPALPQCWIGDFTDLEGGENVNASPQREAGTIPSKYFHFLAGPGLLGG